MINPKAAQPSSPRPAASKTSAFKPAQRLEDALTRQGNRSHDFASEHLANAPPRPNWAAALTQHCLPQLQGMGPGQKIAVNVMSDCAGMASDVFALTELAAAVNAQGGSADAYHASMTCRAVCVHQSAARSECQATF